jgi:hypothetical protein
MFYGLVLNEREHAIAATKAENAYFKECYEKI